MNSGHWQPSTKAIKVLRKLITVIKNEPLRFDMAFWVAYNHTNPIPPPCKTTACLAGWVSIIENRAMGKPRLIAKLEKRWDNCSTSQNSLMRQVFDALDLRGRNRSAVETLLFHDGNWRPEFRDNFTSNPGTKKEFRKNANITVKLLESVIANGIRWESPFAHYYTWIQ